MAVTGLHRKVSNCHVMIQAGTTSSTLPQGAGHRWCLGAWRLGDQPLVSARSALGLAGCAAAGGGDSGDRSQLPRKDIGVAEALR